MKLQISLVARIPFQVLAFVLAFVSFASMPVHACTIFVLTNTNRALFCNNEDWSETKTRIWFLPAGDGYYGAVYVGFDNGFAQGGLNTEGLAFDGVAG
jgi:penicillin V acylase-like amidase (Ntn superfamily)